MSRGALATRPALWPQDRVWVLGWCALVAVLLLLRLGAAPLFDVDEGAFAEATREMLASGDFGHTTLNGADRFDKPILIYWLQAASVSLLGLSELALRLPSALATAAWAGALVLFAWPRFGLPVALTAGTVLVSSVGVLAVGRAATADACLNLFITLAAFDLWRCIERQDPQARNRLWLWMGLGLLTKGPVAVLVPVAATLLWAASSRRLASLRPVLLHVPGWLILLAVAGPWYGYALHRHGMAFVNGFLLHHNLDRFTGALEGHAGFPGYHLLALPLLMLPWTPVLASVAWQARRWWAEPLARWLLCWAGFVLIFFSLAATRLPHYGLYGATPLALLAARQLGRARPSLQAALAASLALTGALWLLGPSLAQALSGSWQHAGYRALLQGAPDTSVLVAAAAALALALVVIWRQPLNVPLSVSLRAGAAALLVAGGGTTLAVPWWGEALQGPVRRLVEVAREPLRAGGAAPLVQWRLHRPSAAVYLGEPVPRRAPAPGELALTPLDRLTADDRATLDLLASDRDLALVQRRPLPAARPPVAP